MNPLDLTMSAALTDGEQLVAWLLVAAITLALVLYGSRRKDKE